MIKEKRSTTSDCDILHLIRGLTSINSFESNQKSEAAGTWESARNNWTTKLEELCTSKMCFVNNQAFPNYSKKLQIIYAGAIHIVVGEDNSKSSARVL